MPAYREGHAKPGYCSHTKQGLAVLAPHIVRVPQRQHRHRVVLTYSDARQHAAILESILSYVKAGSHVLDVGTGAGMFAAMLYHRTGKDGVTVSLSPSTEMVDLAKHNLIADGLGPVLQKGRILLIKDDEKSGTMTLLLMLSSVIKLGSGYAPCSPYDVIHVTKVMEEIPPQLLTQLASPGRMVIPIRTDRRDAMIQVDKDVAGNVSQRAIRLVKI